MGIFVAQGLGVQPRNVKVDFDRLLALCREIEIIEPTGADTTVESLRVALKWRGHTPTQERWVVTASDEPDKFIAYAWVFAQSQKQIVTFIGVHPFWRCRGLGSALLAHTLTRARQYGATHVTGGRWEPAMPAHHFLIHHGFEPAGHNRFFDRFLSHARR